MTRARFVVVVALLALGIGGVPAVAAAADAPTVTKVSPDYGPTAGGTSVTITGRAFGDVHAVRFGGKAAKFHRVSSTKLQATTPAHTAGRVNVAVVTAVGKGIDKTGYQYATRAPRPVGAGYVVPHADARSGNMRVVVPRLRCAPHENSGLGALVQPVRKLRLGDGWAGSVAFRCIAGHARYHANLRCGDGPSYRFGAPQPGDVVTISYSPNQIGMSIISGNDGTGTACAHRSSNSPPPMANEAAVAFLVKTASTPPASLQSLTVHVTAGRGRLSNAHPTRQSQPLGATTVLRPGAIHPDGKTFTARVQHR